MHTTPQNNLDMEKLYGRVVEQWQELQFSKKNCDNRTLLKINSQVQ